MHAHTYFFLSVKKNVTREGWSLNLAIKSIFYQFIPSDSSRDFKLKNLPLALVNEADKTSITHHSEMFEMWWVWDISKLSRYGAFRTFILRTIWNYHLKNFQTISGQPFNKLYTKDEVKFINIMKRRSGKNMLLCYITQCNFSSI